MEAPKGRQGEAAGSRFPGNAGQYCHLCGCTARAGRPLAPCTCRSLSPLSCGSWGHGCSGGQYINGSSGQHRDVSWRQPPLARRPNPVISAASALTAGQGPRNWQSSEFQHDKGVRRCGTWSPSPGQSQHLSKPHLWFQHLLPRPPIICLLCLVDTFLQRDRFAQPKIRNLRDSKAAVNQALVGVGDVRAAPNHDVRRLRGDRGQRAVPAPPRAERRPVHSNEPRGASKPAANETSTTCRFLCPSCSLACSATRDVEPHPRPARADAECPTQNLGQDGSGQRRAQQNGSAASPYQKLQRDANLCRATRSPASSDMEWLAWRRLPDFPSPPSKAEAHEVQSIPGMWRAEKCPCSLPSTSRARSTTRAMDASDLEVAMDDDVWLPLVQVGHSPGGVECQLCKTPHAELQTGRHSTKQT